MTGAAVLPPDRPWWRRPGRDSERGSITTFVVLMVIPMVLMAGLAFDGGRILTARRLAADTAQNAALAGAQAVAGPAVRTGRTALDADQAVAAAEEYLARNGASGTVAVVGDEVEVTVTASARLALLPMVGIASRLVSGTGRATLVRGVNQADQPATTGPSP